MSRAERTRACIASSMSPGLDRHIRRYDLGPSVSVLRARGSHVRVPGSLLQYVQGYSSSHLFFFTLQRLHALAALGRRTLWPEF